MPLGLAMLLYLTCAFALAMAGGIGLSAMFAPVERPETQKQIIAKPPAQNPAPRATVQKEPEPKAAAAPKAAAKPAAQEPVTETTGAARAPTWIAPTPSYNLPPPPSARAQQAADKKARQAKRKAPKQKPRPRHEPGEEDYGRATAHGPYGRGPAYGYAAPPRFFLFGGGVN